MDIDYYKQLLKIISDELNVHDVVFPIGDTEKGELSVIYHSSLGFTDEPDDLYVSLDGKKIDAPKTLITALEIILKGE